MEGKNLVVPSLIKYHEVDELLSCECHGRPVIDEDHLEQYSSKILRIVLGELERCLKEMKREENRNPFQYSGVMMDSDGMESFLDAPKNAIKELSARMTRVDNELKSRGITC